jgi:uncharacterized protein YggE
MKGKTLLLVTCLMVVFATFAAGVSAADSTSSDHVIMTSATGEVTATPDRGELSFSVQSENRDVQVAQGENAVIMNRSINALLAAGIPKEDIKTTGYSIYPVYENSGGIFTNNIKLYRVTNTLLVTVLDLNRTGEVIDIAVANGVNQVNSISFLLSEDQEQAVRTLALQEAVARARMDADAVAQATGTTITGIKEISTGGNVRPIMYNDLSSAKMAGEGMAVPTPIQPGEIQVTASISITYLIG